MDTIKSIGIMTGNSLDAVDVVLNEINLKTNKTTQLYSISYYLPADIADGIRKIRVLLKESKYNIEKFLDNPQNNLVVTHNAYLRRVAETVNALITEAEKKKIVKKDEIDIIGFHGQTLGHFPPSIAEGKDPYTTQLGDGQALADMVGIPVVYDFRSDDIMNGGEGAPLAPMYNYHIIKQLKDVKNVAFCNAGNTGNIAIISKNTKLDKVEILGWDTGPFNHFPDFLMRNEQDNEPYDIDGILGRKGSLNTKLLNSLFSNSATTRSGENFLLIPPPRSSDPSWYKMVREIEPISEISFTDRLRTAEYFSAYVFAYSLSFIPEDVEFPETFILCGGGWKNPIITQDFKNILNGRGVILPQHEAVFAKFTKRIPKDVKVVPADSFNLSSKFMEAGIFADMAVHRVLGNAYTVPNITGAKKESVCGIIRYPKEASFATARIQKLVAEKKTKDLTKDEGFVDPRLSRAVKGWKKRI